MIWPFTAIGELERIVDRQDLRYRNLAEDHRKLMEAWAKDTGEKQSSIKALTDERDALKAAVEELRAEIEELKKPKLPTGPFYSCQCGSHHFVTAGHIIGWKKGEDRAIPIPLGGILHCRNCGSLWDATDDGVERSKPLPPAQMGGAKRETPPPPPRADEDLRWDARDR